MYKQKAPFGSFLFSYIQNTFSLSAKLVVLCTHYYLFVFMTFKKFVFVIPVFLVALLFSASSTFAQNPVAAGIGISPATIEKGANPGETQTHSITIANLSGAEQTYYLYLRDIVSVEDGGVPVFAEEGQEKTGYELSQWLTLNTTELSMKPGEEKQVDVSIAVPNEATPGSHFGAVVVSMQPPRLRSTGAAVGYEVANIISIRIAGDATELAQIRSFSTGNFVYSEPKIDFSARIENKGNVLLRPYGPLEIYNMFGKRVSMITLNETRAGIFPLSERTFSVVWESDGGGFGRYEAILSMVYGEQGRQSTITSTTSFWILPLKIILPALGVLAFLLITAYISVKLYIRNKLKYAAMGGSRRVVRSRRQTGISALLLVLVVMLSVTALFLVILLALFA
jgi:hypothetical protein